MRALFFTFGCIIILGAGCRLSAPSVSTIPSTSTMKTPAGASTFTEKFALTTEPQDAMFHIAIGWTGGMGSMPVLDVETGRPKTFQGSQIYFDESYRDKVRAKLPGCIVGEPEIVVSANVTLTRRRDINTAIEDAPEETYYEAVVNRLDDVQAQAEPCE